jgi:hypothetical protein
LNNSHKATATGMEAIAKGLLSAGIAYTVHYGAVKAYDNFCVPDGIWGFLQGMVTTGSPLCAAGVKVISNTEVSYSTLVLMGITRVALDWIAPGSAAACSTGACPAL